MLINHISTQEVLAYFLPRSRKLTFVRSTIQSATLRQIYIFNSFYINQERLDKNLKEKNIT